MHFLLNQHVFQGLLPSSDTDIFKYIERTNMAEDTVWGTQVEIFGMAHLLSTNIFIYTQYGNNKKWLLHTGQTVSSRFAVKNEAIFLDHKQGIHYEVVTDVKSTSGLAVKNEANWKN